MLQISFWCFRVKLATPLATEKIDRAKSKKTLKMETDIEREIAVSAMGTIVRSKYTNGNSFLAFLFIFSYPLFVKKTSNNFPKPIVHVLHRKQDKHPFLPNS